MKQRMTRQERRIWTKENAKRPAMLTEAPRSKWPYAPEGLRRVWASRHYMVQLWDDNGFERLSICRIALQEDGDWADGIGWDELQAIKREIGFADRWAVECFPADHELVNVSNMRHLFLLPAPPAYAWTFTTEGTA